jgi:predicted transcriptional regulator
MSDKQLVLDIVNKLPDEATLEEIRERIEFISAMKEAEESLEQGQGIPHEEVEKQFSSWVKEWNLKSSGRPSHLKT